MNKSYKLTQAGIDELKAELESLIAQRPEITDRIKSAREMGDLSENAEYASARTEQDRNENRIKEIDYILKNTEVIRLVGTVEADPVAGKISDESPIGKVLIGKSVGDIVEIATPAESTNYTIVTIQ
ncbi:MAG: transcription elongation factor GreA [Patescibacteria group bacterium]|nr:transcription elongation factor GreA [Patescibacteria group bacterium]